VDSSYIFPFSQFRFFSCDSVLMKFFRGQLIYVSPFSVSFFSCDFVSMKFFREQLIYVSPFSVSFFSCDSVFNEMTEYADIIRRHTVLKKMSQFAVLPFGEKVRLTPNGMTGNFLRFTCVCSKNSLFQ
jgi:hypothetical protein